MSGVLVPACVVRAEQCMTAFAEHAQRLYDHAQRTLTCTSQVLYLKHSTFLRIHSNVSNISGLFRRVSVVHDGDYLIISLKPPHHRCPGLKVGVRMHTPWPVGVQVNKLGVAGNNLGVSNIGVNNIGVTTTRLEPSATPSTIFCTPTSSTNTARSS